MLNEETRKTEALPDSIWASLTHLTKEQQRAIKIATSSINTNYVNDNPLQYSCRENPKDSGAWQATVHGATKSWTHLSHKNNRTMQSLYLTL